PAHLPADDKRHQQPADPVPLEVEGDRDARPPAAIQRLDRAVDRPGTGPPTVRHAQDLGGCNAVISSVRGNRRGPICPVTTARKPTAGGPVRCWRTDTTLACHSAKREESVT